MGATDNMHCGFISAMTTVSVAMLLKKTFLKATQDDVFQAILNF